jgi:hypothetical protein
MTWDYNHFTHSRTEANIDSYRSREIMKMLHLLVRYAAKWEPDNYGLKNSRWSLQKMDPNYAMEFVWIMTEYKACKIESLEILLKTPGMRSLIAQHTHRLDEMMNSLRIH